jgi:hypothetical protein
MTFVMALIQALINDHQRNKLYPYEAKTLNYKSQQDYAYKKISNLYKSSHLTNNEYNRGKKWNL